jgi:hypothetical protein
MSFEWFPTRLVAIEFLVVARELERVEKVAVAESG